MKKYILALATMIAFTGTASAQIVLGADDGRPQTFQVLIDEPQFIGGRDSLNSFLLKNLRYPAEARAAKAGGTVYVKAIVNKDSTLSDIKVEGGKSLMPCLREEALRVVAMMPKWKPGRENGIVIRALITIPVAFKLD